MTKLSFQNDERVFITSDWHLGHKNIAGPNSRWKSGFRRYENVQDMDDDILKSVMCQVGSEDHLIILGDVSFYNWGKTHEMLQSIDCKSIHVVWGNHDKHLRKDSELLFDSSHDLLNLKIGGQKAVCCHFPLYSWEGMHRNAVHFHGHTHGHLRYNNRALDVGVDMHSIPMMINAADAMERLKRLEFQRVDHHSE